VRARSLLLCATLALALGAAHPGLASAKGPCKFPEKECAGKEREELRVAKEKYVEAKEGAKEKYAEQVERIHEKYERSCHERPRCKAPPKSKETEALAKAKERFKERLASARKKYEARVERIREKHGRAGASPDAVRRIS